MRRSSETRHAFLPGSGYAFLHNIPTTIALKTTTCDFVGCLEQVIIVQPLLSCPMRERLSLPYFHNSHI